jgi:hypothetical protein
MLQFTKKSIEDQLETKYHLKKKVYQDWKISSIFSKVNAISSIHFLFFFIVG